MYHLLNNLNLDNREYFSLLFESMHGNDNCYLIAEDIITNFKKYVSDSLNGKIMFLDKFNDDYNYSTSIILDDTIVNVNINVYVDHNKFEIKGRSINYDKYSIYIDELVTDKIPQYADIENILIHELHHIYQNIKSKGKIDAFNKIDYHRVLKAAMDNNLPDYISNFFYCLYLMNKIEIDANVPLIYNELKSLNVAKEDIKEKMKMMPSWKKYNSVRAMMNKVLDYDKIKIEKIAQKYCEVFRMSYHPTDINIVKNLAIKNVNNANKVLRRMAVNAKKYYDELN